MSPVSLIPRWSGTEPSYPVNEFCESTEGTSKVEDWSDSDKIQVAILELTDAARLFYNSRIEKHSSDITWTKFQSMFYRRFQDVRTDQFHI